MLSNLGKWSWRVFTDIITNSGGGLSLCISILVHPSGAARHVWGNEWPPARHQGDAIGLSHAVEIPWSLAAAAADSVQQMPNGSRECLPSAETKNNIAAPIILIDFIIGASPVTDSFVLLYTWVGSG